MRDRDRSGDPDVSEAMALRALRESEERYRQIVESTTDGIVKVDVEVAIVFANGRFAELLGREPEELLGVNLYSLMDEPSRTIATQARERRLQGIRDIIEITFLRKDGGTVMTSMSGAPIFDSSGRYSGALALVQDVTEKKKLTAQLMISDRMASVGTLAAGVAHEINNPLAIVIANLQFLAKSLPSIRDPKTAAPHFDDDLEASLADALDAVERVRVIVRDLQLFARSPDEEKRGELDVHKAIESSLGMAAHEIRSRARVVRDYGEVSAVWADEGLLAQAFLNLLVNAAQAIPPGHPADHEIRVTTRREGERVVVEVKDTGEGIPEANLPRIFDAFFTTKPVGVGTGLGLTSSHRIVASLGGELSVESRLGQGTTFRVSLPVASRQHIADASSARKK